MSGHTESAAALMTVLYACFPSSAQVYRNAESIPDGESGCLYLLGMCTPFYKCYARDSLRTNIRQQRDISGTQCGDWFYTTCCFQLSLVQESQEMKELRMERS